MAYERTTAAILLLLGFLVTISDARGNAWSQQDGWNVQNGGENNFGSWSPEESQLKDDGNWNNQPGGQDGGRWGRQAWSRDAQSKEEAWGDNSQAKESYSPDQEPGNQISGFSPSDAQVKDYGKRNGNQGNFRPEDSQSKDWNRNQGSFGPEDSQSKDYNRNQGSFGPEDSQSKDWNRNQGGFGPEDSQSKDYNRNQGTFAPQDSQTKDWNNNENAAFDSADGQRKVSGDWNNGGGGADSQPWVPEDAQVKNENWGQKKIDEGFNQGKVWGQQNPGSNPNWDQGTGNGDGSSVQGGTDWNQGQNRPPYGEGQTGDQGPIAGGPSTGTNGGRWDGGDSSGRPIIGQGDAGPSVGQDQGISDGQWNGNSYPEGIGQSDGQGGPSIGQGGIGPSVGQGGIGPSIGQGGIVPSIGQGGIGTSVGQGGIGPSVGQGGIGSSIGQGGIGPSIGQGGIGPSAGQGGIGPSIGQGDTGVPQDGPIVGERGDSGGDGNELFPPRVPQGNYKGGDTPHPGGEGDGGPWRLEDSIPGQPGVDYPNYSVVPETGFDCKQHENPGYYGDVEARCQVFHICQSDGRHDSFLCPLGTVFNQQHFVCVWWFDYNCEDTQMYYALNADLYKVGAQGNFKGDDYRPPASQDQPGRRVDQKDLPGPTPALGTPVIGVPDRGINSENIPGPNPISSEQPLIVPLLGDDLPGTPEGDFGPNVYSTGVVGEDGNGINNQGPAYGQPNGIPVQNQGTSQPGYGQVDQTGPPRLDPGIPPQTGFGQSGVVGQQDLSGGSNTQGKRNWGSNPGSSAGEGNWRNGVKGGWKSPDESSRGRKARSWGSYDGLEKRFGSEGAAASNWISLEAGLEDEIHGGNIVESNAPETNGSPVEWDEEQTQWESGLKKVEDGGDRNPDGNMVENMEPERNGNRVQWEPASNEVGRRSGGNLVENNGDWKPERNGNRVQWEPASNEVGRRSGGNLVQRNDEWKLDRNDNQDVQWVSGVEDGHGEESEPERNEKDDGNWDEEWQFESGRREKSRQETDSGESAGLVNEVIPPRIWRTVEPAKRNWWQDQLGAVKRRRRRDIDRWWRHHHHSGPPPQRWDWNL